MSVREVCEGDLYDVVCQVHRLVPVYCRVCVLYYLWRVTCSLCVMRQCQLYLFYTYNGLKRGTFPNTVLCTLTMYHHMYYICAPHSCHDYHSLPNMVIPPSKGTNLETTAQNYYFGAIVLFLCII